MVSPIWQRAFAPPVGHKTISALRKIIKWGAETVIMEWLIHKRSDSRYYIKLKDYDEFYFGKLSDMNHIFFFLYFAYLKIFKQMYQTTCLSFTTLWKSNSINRMSDTLRGTKHTVWYKVVFDIPVVIVTSFILVMMIYIDMI